MKKINKRFVKTILNAACLTGVLFITGCNPKDEMGSINNPSNMGNRPQPVVDSIGQLQENSWTLGGVGKLKIYGKNFSTVMSENLIQFNDKQGVLLNATATQLDVLVPYVVKDTVVIRISVNKALLYSNTKLIKTKDPIASLFTDKFIILKSLAVDKAGNIYASTTNETGVKNGIKKFDPATGKFNDFFSKDAMPVSFWNSMKFGPDGTLYCVGAQRRIAIIPAAGGSTAPGTFATFPTADGVTDLSDLDFDASKNIWTGGTVAANKIYSVDPAKTITTFAFDGKVHALTVYNGYLYIAARRGQTDKVYKLKINSATSLGTEEVYFDFGAKYSSANITDLSFSSDGFMYIGMDATPGMVLVNPGGTASEDYYTLVLQPAGTYNNALKYSSFIWGKDNLIYTIIDRSINQTTSENKLISIIPMKSGAPSFGIQ